MEVMFFTWRKACTSVSLANTGMVYNAWLLLLLYFVWSHWLGRCEGDAVVVP